MRVPLDFKWPMNMVWKGYICPYSSLDCKACDRSGYNPATKAIADDWYDFAGTGRRWINNITQDEVQALVDGGRLMDFTHEWVPGDGWKEKNPPCVPTATQVNAWSEKGMGHDAINRWICVEARATRLGVFGKCETCGGTGEIWQSPEIEKLAEEWESFDPPTGDGFQLWETTSEGSPTSPVFASIEALCEWAESNATTFGSFKASKEKWREMLDEDFVCHAEGGNVFI